ncbi:MAG: DUF2179 domain-containing protein [Candidatus Krumholzibacteriota bacterium]|nr:DUF2179 domain-containing protein [Candidatus Krumholzibacteriota bacterium]
MIEPAVLESDLFRWLLIPAMIFVARIVDVSIGTLRIVFVSRGRKYIAPLLGFFEVIVWLLAIGQIMRNLSNWVCYVAYGGGFAAGTYVGLLLEEKLAMGTIIMRIITRRDASRLIAALRGAHFGVTAVPAEGMLGPVSIVYSVVRRTDLTRVARIIEEHNPQAFYTIEDTKVVREGHFPLKGFVGPQRFEHLFRRGRKGK